MTVLTAENVTVRFGDREAVRQASFAVESGELIALIGPNGAGKTTLLRALADLVPRADGRVLLDDTPIEAMPRRTLARHLGYLAQGPIVHWPLKVHRLVTLGRLPHLEPWRRPAATDERAIENAMREADVLHLAERSISTLSGGERVRAMLARALAVEPRVLLADEPIAALDPYHQLQVMEFLATLAMGGRAAIVVLHDLTMAMRFCQRLILLDEGRVHADGPPDEVLTPATLEAVYGVAAKFGEGADSFVLPWQRITREPRGGAES